MHSITIKEFNTLSDNRKKQLLVDALKLTEQKVGQKKIEIYKINDFFVEVTTDFSYKVNRQIKSYIYNDIPASYASDVVHYMSHNQNLFRQTFMVEYLH